MLLGLTVVAGILYLTRSELGVREQAGVLAPTVAQTCAQLPAAEAARRADCRAAEQALADPAIPQGEPGDDGAPGIAGQDGRDGATGAAGLDGAPGAAGLDGAPGAAGLDGAAGTAGRDGVDGSAGPPGQDGRDGAPGADGAMGAPGSDGAAGPSGAPGSPPASFTFTDPLGTTYTCAPDGPAGPGDRPSYTCSP